MPKSLMGGIGYPIELSGIAVVPLLLGQRDRKSAAVGSRWLLLALQHQHWERRRPARMQSSSRPSQLSSAS